MSHAARHTCTDPDWYTPAPFVEAARQVMGGIDLDPASDEIANRTVQAGRIFTADDDGLSERWRGRVFLNPPGGWVKPFWAKLMAELAQLLDVHGRSLEAIWIGYSLEQFQTLQVENRMQSPLDFPFCVPKRRIAFLENPAMRRARHEEWLAKQALARLQGKKVQQAFPELRSPSHANYISYLGPHVDRFADVFSQFGTVVL